MYIYMHMCVCVCVSLYVCMCDYKYECVYVWCEYIRNWRQKANKNHSFELL